MQDKELQLKVANYFYNKGVQDASELIKEAVVPGMSRLRIDRETNKIKQREKKDAASFRNIENKKVLRETPYQKDINAVMDFARTGDVEGDEQMQTPLSFRHQLPSKAEVSRRYKIKGTDIGIVPEKREIATPYRSTQRYPRSRGFSTSSPFGKIRVTAPGHNQAGLLNSPSDASGADHSPYQYHLGAFPRDGAGTSDIYNRMNSSLSHGPGTHVKSSPQYTTFETSPSQRARGFRVPASVVDLYQRFDPDPRRRDVPYLNPIVAAHEFAHQRFGADEVEADSLAATTDYNLWDVADLYQKLKDDSRPENLELHDDVVSDPELRRRAASHEGHLDDDERIALLASMAQPRPY